MNYMDTSWLLTKVILKTKNIFCQKLDEKDEDMIPGPSETYLSADSVRD